MMSVQVKKEALRELPSFLAPTLTFLSYGDHVTSLNEKDDWVEIQSSKKKGWIHSSALCDKEIVLMAGSKKAQKSVTANEAVMAGKGFSSQVESEYRAQHPTLRFDIINRMEAYSIPLKTQRIFATDGQLKF